MNSNDLKMVVQEKYGQIALQSMIQGQSFADLELGCGIPTQNHKHYSFS